jgi:hypothetical protein
MHRHLSGSVIADICSTKPEASTMLLDEALIEKSLLLLLLRYYSTAPQPRLSNESAAQLLQHER